MYVCVCVSVSIMAKGLSGKRTVHEGNAGGKSTLRRYLAQAFVCGSVGGGFRCRPTSLARDIIYRTFLWDGGGLFFSEAGAYFFGGGTKGGHFYDAEISFCQIFTLNYSIKKMKTSNFPTSQTLFFTQKLWKTCGSTCIKCQPFWPVMWPVHTDSVPIVPQYL